ncbi:D-alanyl-D-alanine carboxypeptidase family protein [Macrococcus armenti]|uniref:D-alanyl-D-alanine carboxypeptidase family protein n=1 Tax=Macrococcus armenti TaxID=2875764 RepID=UPI002407CB91|nr:D-alanyl-D-alanine carboxypeptidase family protein [Macrococcus armenti]
MKSCKITVTYSGGLYKINNIPIANKLYGISRKYNPGANKTMIKQYKLMKADALKKGIYLDIVGAPNAYGFRSYETQKALYNNYISMYGYDYASKISAKPGTSEHQLGLAMDMQ